MIVGLSRIETSINIKYLLRDPKTVLENWDSYTYTKFNLVFLFFFFLHVCDVCMYVCIYVHMLCYTYAGVCV